MVLRKPGPGWVLAGSLLVVGLLALLLVPNWTLGKGCQPQQPQAEPPALLKEKPIDPNAAETKIKELEAKVHLSENALRQLHSHCTAQPPQPAPAPAVAQTPLTPYIEPPLNQMPPTVYYEPVTTYRPDGTAITYYRMRRVGAGQGPVQEEIHLTRTTYKLPAAKADALATFLTGHVKAAVMEVKQDGGSLTVTTTPEAQRAVAEFVTLMQPRPGERPEPPPTVPPVTPVRSY
jgi:hypothetical protein